MISLTRCSQISEEAEPPRHNHRLHPDHISYWEVSRPTFTQNTHHLAVPACLRAPSADLSCSLPDDTIRSINISRPSLMETGRQLRRQIGRVQSAARFAYILRINLIPERRHLWPRNGAHESDAVGPAGPLMGSNCDCAVPPIDALASLQLDERRTKLQKFLLPREVINQPRPSGPRDARRWECHRGPTWHPRYCPEKSLIFGKFAFQQVPRR